MFTGLLTVEESQSSSALQVQGSGSLALVEGWYCQPLTSWELLDREWTDRHPSVLIVSGHRLQRNKLSTNCCLRMAEALAGTSGLWCTSPLKEFMGNSSTPSLSTQASGYLAYWEPDTPYSFWSGQACCQYCCHLHLSHSHAKPSPCMGNWAPCSVLRRSSKPPVCVNC